MDKKKQNLQIVQENLITEVDWNKSFGEKLSFLTCDELHVKQFCNEKGLLVSIDDEVDKTRASQVTADMRQLIFFFGLGSIEELLKVAKRSDPTSVFVIIEPNLSILKTVIEIDDLRKINGLKYMLIAGHVDEFETTLKKIINTSILLLLKKPVFYFNSYYRENELKLVKEHIVVLRNVILDQMFRVGNDIYDSLMGLVNNLKNLRHISNTLDTAYLKGKFKNVPIFVVAAGPSLDKNMHELRRVRDKGIIIAVDTIAEKLVHNGIVPHFIASVERFNVWEYFYKDKSNYYGKSYLLAPPVAQVEVVELYGERAVLPMRESPREYIWLADMLGLNRDHFIWMGGSCAHIAVGFAMHLGGCPIVLVGQDLAYGESVEKTHAIGTTYDIIPEEKPEVIYTVDGYYGQPVKTQEIWNNFKSLYEDFFRKTSTKVINATEGGAKIKGTEQASLADVIDKYCVREVGFTDLLERTPKVALDFVKIDAKMKQYYLQTLQRSNESAAHLKKLVKLEAEWDKYFREKGPKYIFKLLNITEQYFQMATEDMLLYHNLQGQLLVLMQKFHTIPNNGSEKSLKENLALHIDFCELYTKTSWLIAQVIKENYPWQEAEKC